jgi:hypothetical protein
MFLLFKDGVFLKFHRSDNTPEGCVSKDMPDGFDENVHYPTLDENGDVVLVDKTSQEYSDLMTLQYTIDIGNKAEEFGKNLMSKFRGENIAMGITQAGMSGPVISVMTERIDVNNDGHPLDVKSTVETGTLYEAIKVIDHHIAKAQNGDYNSMIPFVTVDRLLQMKNDILNYLS